MSGRWYKICVNGDCFYDIIHDIDDFKHHYDVYRPDVEYTVKRVKVKRLSLDEIEEIVKTVLMKHKNGMGTINLLRECHEYGLFLTRPTFLKKLNEILKRSDWLEQDMVGWAYVWTVSDGYVWGVKDEED